MEYLAYFAAGALLANGVPHFVNGVSGNKFQSPFAKPPGVGESSPVTNVIWGLINFLAGMALLMGIGKFNFGFTLDFLVLLVGFCFMALFLAAYFGRIRGAQQGNQE